MSDYDVTADELGWNNPPQWCFVRGLPEHHPQLGDDVQISDSGVEDIYLTAT